MKKILMVCDVYGWGGHVRAEYIKKYLSDEFQFDIMDGLEFEKFYEEKFKTEEDDYDLIYLLFHTQLLRKDVRDMIDKGDRRFMTIVTTYPTIRAGFINGITEKRAIHRFLSIANNCKAILANNNKSLEDLRSIYRRKTFYAPRGVDESIFYPIKEFKEKPVDEYTVAYVGKPVEEKGLETIIRPACKNAGVKLIVNTRNFTNALSPEKMREFYNKADVYAVASIIDGTPNPALEAAACGLTLVANEIGNMPELINNHKNGFIIERTIREYSHRFKWMKNNQRIAWEIGQRGRETVLKDWTWKNVLNKNERIIFREL